ncbi:hypothetical protein [Candidatus Thiosymbion oneisti]|uniref:hypothetical protein n=1 Tax=Candidatus Thiosymbion oneisti TaxID=589554 RepID=UPI00114D2B70|nr:hypothetical protein [Candidatus Thiosymbion oneisti]
MKERLRALRRRSSVFVWRWRSRLRHPSWYYSWPTPFVLWRDGGTGGADVGRSDAIYLWPNGLRWWFLGFALFFVFSVIFSLGSNSPNSGSNSPSLWYSLGISLVVFVWMVWLYPFLVFYVLRREVLSDLWGTWPPQMDALYGGAPELVARSGECSLFRALLSHGKHGLRRLGRRLGTCLPYGRGYRSAANDGSVQAALERAALKDYFASKPSLVKPSLADIWCDRGFRRWLTTRCGPVVAGQLVVLVLVILAFLFQAKEAVLLILVWTVFAAGFLWHAVCAFERECRVSLKYLSRLPYLTHALENTYLLQTLPQLSVPLVVAVAGINLTFAIPLFGVL